MFLIILFLMMQTALRSDVASRNLHGGALVSGCQIFWVRPMASTYAHELGLTCCSSLCCGPTGLFVTTSMRPSFWWVYAWRRKSYENKLDFTSLFLQRAANGLFRWTRQSFDHRRASRISIADKMARLCTEIRVLVLCSHSHEINVFYYAVAVQWK